MIRLPDQSTSGPCLESEVLHWLLLIIDVLQELHSRRPPVMHRDIKPGNIVLKPDNTAVLVDFGLTKLYDPNVSTQTLGRAVTEGFSPIEQYVGEDNTTIRYLFDGSNDVSVVDKPAAASGHQTCFRR